MMPGINFISFIRLILLVAAMAYWINVFVVLYHLIRFGVGTTPKKIAFIFFTGSIILLFLSAVLYSFIDLSYFSKNFSPSSLRILTS